tara:strand:+ start:1281 stop:1490 length:210 start_codon:yes stop_codon:yes gene_type:complete
MSISCGGFLAYSLIIFSGGLLVINRTQYRADDPNKIGPLFTKLGQQLKNAIARNGLVSISNSSSPLMTF